MREILFRAWDGKRYSIGKPEYFDDSVNFRFHHFDINCEKPILEQFTGLNDATKWEDLTDAERDEWIKSGHTKEDWKGRRIFEGDIVRINHSLHVDLVVSFQDGCFCFGLFNGKSFGDFVSVRESMDQARRYFEEELVVEVIGNIHNNPELLS